jgi:two-component system CheB/CheR fusion protein
VLRSLNVGVVVIDDKHIVQSWNRWSENAWGLRAEEVIGSSLESLDIGFPLHMLREDLLSVLTKRVPQTEQVLEGIDRRGRKIICRVRIAGLVGDGGVVDGVVLAFEDVTEERRKEEYTRYLGRVMGRALNEIYFLEPETLRFVLANHGAEKKLECSANQVTQLTLPDVMPRHDLKALNKLFAPLLARKKDEIVFETVIRSVEGKEYPAELCVQYFGDELPPILVAMVHDTSDRQILAAQ